MFRLTLRHHMDGFLAGAEVDEGCENVDEDLAQEVSCRHILHWNYRGFTSLPRELLGI